MTTRRGFIGKVCSLLAALPVLAKAETNEKQKPISVEEAFGAIKAEEAAMIVALTKAGWVRSEDSSLRYLIEDTQLPLVVYRQAENPEYFYSGRGLGYEYPIIDYTEDDLWWHAYDGEMKELAEGTGAESLKTFLSKQ